MNLDSIKGSIEQMCEDRFPPDSRKLEDESRFFKTVSGFRFQDLGFSHPYIDLQGAIRAGKQIMHSPYAWQKDTFLDGWEITHLHPWRTKMSIIEEATSKPGARVVDIGCGSGSIALEMSRLGAHVTGMDLCEESIRIANLAKERARDTVRGSLEYIVANARDIDWPANSLDAIVSVAFIHHLPQAGQFIQKAHRALQEGGKLLILDHYDVKTRWNGRLEAFARFLTPSAYTPFVEKLTLLHRTGALGPLLSLPAWLILPHPIPLLTSAKVM